MAKSSSLYLRKLSPKWRKIIEAMWAARAKMQPLGMSIPEMIEEGRER
jgi:hypothetical protein